jgi:hypothetical protein
MFDRIALNQPRFHLKNSQAASRKNMPQSVKNGMLRQKRNIARRGALWTVGELKQLGKVPDSVLASRTGRTIKEVTVMLGCL